MPHSDTARQFATTLLLLVLTASVAAFILLVEWRAPAPPADAGQPAPALAIAAEKIDYIALSHENLAAELTRLQGNWTITAPIKARADAGRINHLLAIAENLPRLETITESQRQARGVTLADYGLATPFSRIVLGAGGRRTTTLDVGNLSPLKDALYIRFDLQSEIIATATNLLDVIPRVLEDLRDTRLVSGNPAAIGRIEIKRAQGPLIKIVREGGDWIIQRPVTARADRQKVMQFLEQIYDLRIAQFISETMADPVAYGLSDDEASLQLSLWPETGDYSLKINFGKPGAGGALLFAAQADATSVYAVPRAAVEALPAQLATLRDTRLYCLAPEKTAFVAIESDGRILHMQKTNGIWQITAPIQAKASTLAVTDLIHRLNSLRIANFIEPTDAVHAALEKPDLIVRLSENPPPAATLTQQVENAAAPAPADRPAGGRVLRISACQTVPAGIYARFDDDQQIVQLSAAAVNAISADAADYRDLAVLGIDPGDIRTISCAAKGISRAVERDANGVWRLAAPDAAGEQKPPPPAIIARILSLAADLRAVRFERGATSDLARYGLAEPSFSISFSLTGAAGIRKTILGGQPAEDQGIFGMVQGQSGVFVIDQELAGLCREFLGPQP